MAVTIVQSRPWGRKGCGRVLGDTRAELADVLRGRILRAVHGGALRIGDRLPSARELEAEFGIDHRVVLDSYRLLAGEGLVELRQRGGIYVASADAFGAVPVPSRVWLSELFAQGIAREVPLTELHEWLHRAVGTLRLRAVAIQESGDQVEGLCRELRDDYGFEAAGLRVAELREDGIEARPELRYADVLVTTGGLEAQVRPIAERLRKQMICVEVRADLIAGEWRLLLTRPLFVLVGDEQFVGVLVQFFAATPGRENLRPLVVGRDDLEVIPDGAPVYITRSARGLLEGARIRGRILPSVRLFSPASSQELIRFIVGANLDAIAHRRPRPRDDGGDRVEPE
jgi:DNA-binding transcriptional regulator YhcF (GntR family)